MPTSDPARGGDRTRLVAAWVFINLPARAARPPFEPDGFHEGNSRDHHH